MIEEIKKIIDAGAGVLADPEKFNAFNKIFQSVFNKEVQPCGGCSNGVDQSFSELKSYYLKTINKNTMANSNFILKKGPNNQPVDLICSQGRFSQEQLTDEIALELLAESPASIGLFDKFPADWNSKIEKKSAKTEAPVESDKAAPKTK